MKLPTILIAIGIGLAAAGCSGDDDEEGGSGTTAAIETRSVPPLVETTAVDGGSNREKSLLRSAAGAMEKTSLKEIAIAPAATRRQTDGGRAMAITFTTITEETSRRQWDEWIVAGAFSRRLLAADLPAQVDAQGSRGAFTARPRLKGKPDPQPLPKGKEAAIVKSIRAAAAKAKAEVAALEAHRPYGVAIAVTLAPADPARFLKARFRAFLQSLDRHRPQLEGAYVAVLDGEGMLALEWGSWTRNPAGVYWVRRDLANCSPIRQSEPPGTGPPPACPV